MDFSRLQGAIRFFQEKSGGDEQRRNQGTADFSDNLAGQS